MRLRAHATPLQLLNTIEIGLGLVALGLLRANALVERLHLQNKLLVGHRREFLTGRHAIALLRLQGDDRAPDPRPGNELVHWLNSRNDGFLVLNLRRRDRELVGPQRRGQEATE